MSGFSQVPVCGASTGSSGRVGSCAGSGIRGTWTSSTASISGSYAWQICFLSCSLTCGGFKARLSGALVFDGREGELMLIECLLRTQRPGAFSNAEAFVCPSLWPRGATHRSLVLTEEAQRKAVPCPESHGRMMLCAFPDLRGLVFFCQAGGSYSVVPRPVA